MQKIICLVGLCCLISCNPFAPKLNPAGLDQLNSLGDPKTLDGFFQFFKTSYELRDTNLYGRLFAPEFRFEYYDASQGQARTWDRATEMNTSYRMFQGVQQINLDWNFYVQRDSSDTSAVIVRNFNLSIVENAQSTFNGSGRAKLKLKRANVTLPWKAVYWFDDSDF